MHLNLKHCSNHDFKVVIMVLDKKKDENLIELILQLREESWKQKNSLWRDLANRLEKSSQHWAEVNISHIKRYAKKNDTIVIPGKLLGAGYIDIPVTVAAYKCSLNAKEKISSAGGKFVTIPELVKKNPKGTGIRIFNK